MSPLGKAWSHPSWRKRAERSSIRFATTQVPMSSMPACTWKVSGGSPPSIRVLRTARAFTPAPPVTVALMTSTPGYFCL